MLKPLGPDILHDLDRASKLEWLETNGRGGFASSTVIGANTRRYHGLLTAALDPPVRRHVLLSRVEEIVDDGTTRTELGVNFYPGSVHPRGFEHQVAFRLDPFPTFTWEIGDRRIEKACFLVDGEDTVVLRYSLLKGAPCNLLARPFLAFRDYHALQTADAKLDATVRVNGALVSVRPFDGMPELYFHAAHKSIAVRSDWWKKHRYPVEEERGLDHEEDLWSPFEMRFELNARTPTVLIASTGRVLKLEPHRYEPQERARRASVVASARRAVPDLDEALCLSADAFLVKRTSGGNEPAGATVIAGYPWFTDWGRDTMISLPGLCLALGRHSDARDILMTFAKHLDGGMIPNRFPDSGEHPEYNNIDGTLWFVHAIGRYVAKGNDLTVAERIFLPAVLDVIAKHCAGTRHGIRVHEDGLLGGGEPGVQLTWMDAKVDDWVVTPRSGKPVEINALWIEVLETAIQLCEKLGKTASVAEFRGRVRLARESFAKRFWYEAGGHLFDVVDSNDMHGDDPSLRPNQIFAVSLPHPAIDGDRARAVVDVVQRDLLTPFGLRTLSPNDKRYWGAYTGSRRARDAAYHQGTVWPWLMGPFVRAWLRTHGRTPATIAEARAMVTPLAGSLADFGLGQIAEVHDGDAPHAPRGCIAQAWSTAELVALLADELR